ncbi:hypothetical protein EFY87_05890 [Flexivirga caeni]|uniref:DNA modification methylase n=1 Tax=Flexivirga caeni TaxID=2294115 RepID=A0A3M9MF85_9MICO|nr:hypothetical protein EFY87_05890 [Flexivirga caeni]
MSRPAIGALALAATATTLSGCMYLSPAQTTKSYEAADGTDQTIGDVQLQNLLIVTSAKGQPGALQGLAVNNGQSPVTLTVKAGQSTASLTIPAATAVRLDGKPSGDSTDTVSPVSIASVAVVPGSYQSVSFTTSSAGTTAVQVPVMIDQYPYGTATESHPTYTTPANTQTHEPPA